MRYLLLYIVGITLVRRGEAQSLVHKFEPPNSAPADMTVMTWNILAPIWVNRVALKADGIDLNLLDTDNRVKLVSNEIMNRKPDILALQEVQEDVFVKLYENIKPIYQVVAFAPHEKEYWKSYLPEGVDYMKNGVATFYKRDKLELLSRNTFETNSNGSIALTSVFYPRLAKSQPSRRPWQRNPFIVINCHQESGFTVPDSIVRVSQGALIMKEAERAREVLTNSKPFVIIAGDFNSAHPFPGFANYKTNGYVDALEMAGDPSKLTYFYARPMPLPTGDVFVNGATIDHIFIKNSDISNNRVTFISAKIPDIDSNSLTQDSYVKRLTNIVIRYLQRKRLDKAFKMFSIIMKIAYDDLKSDAQVNRVLRLGSDHLPVIVNVKFPV